MARLIIVVDIDVDPTVEDPEVVAQDLLLADDGTPQEYADLPATLLGAEWAS